MSDSIRLIIIESMVKHLEKTKGSMRKILGLLATLLLLNGCAESVALLGTGASNGRIVKSSFNSVISIGVKKQTGKTPIEHVLSENQIKTLESQKAKINPCKTNEDFCTMMNVRVEKMRKQLLGLSLQSRIEKNHQVLSKIKKN